jgi:Integrase zinc binding domain/RNase H-like domain found in reverse transcriptase
VASDRLLLQESGEKLRNPRQAIIWALEEWRHFLEVSKHRIEIWTDHKNLEYFHTAKKLNRRQACWSLYLSRFDFELHHRPGVTMGKSDALSHHSYHGSGSDDNSDLVLLQPELFVVRTLEGLTLVGEERGILREVRKAFREASLEDEVSGAVQKLRESGGRSLVSAEWAETDGVLTFHGKVFVPDDHDLRRQVVAQHHDSRVVGHPGQWKTLNLVSQNDWWPYMSRYIGEYTKTCDLCLRTKACRQPPLGELHPLPVPNVCWDTVRANLVHCGDPTITQASRGEIQSA